MNYPSVTECLRPWQDFSAIPPEVLANAAARGTTCHAAYASYALGLWIPDLAGDCRGYFESFCRWYDSTVILATAVEPALVCKEYGFHGHPDFIGKIKGDAGLVLIDWKNPVGASLGWRLQIAAYHHLAAESFEISRVLIVQPHPKGKRAKVTEHTGTLQRDFANWTIWK